MLKSIEIRKCLFKLQLKMSGVFFETQYIYQTVQYFVLSKTGVLYLTVFKYSLRKP